LLPLAPTVKEAVALALTVLEPLRVLEGVTAAVPVPVLLLLEVGLGEGLTGGVLLPLWELLPLLDAEAPADREPVGEADSVEEADNVEESVAWPVPVPLPVALPVGLTDPVGVTERDADREVLPVLPLLAPSDREAAADTVLLVEPVELGVPVPVPLLLPV